MAGVLVLALETSGQPGSVAVVSESGVLAYGEYAQPNLHAEYLLRQIEVTLDSARCSRRDLNRIAVGVGPGNFTGLRVGMALASGIGMGLHIDVIGVCSLASIAGAVIAPDARLRLVARDARRDEAFCGVFSADGTVLAAPTLVEASQLYIWLVTKAREYAGGGEDFALAGDALKWLSSEQRAELGAHIPPGAESLTPDARVTAQIALRQQSSPALFADYVRDADAKLPNIARNTALDALAGK